MYDLLEYDTRELFIMYCIFINPHYENVIGHCLINNSAGKT